jgi:hypothetical protein
MMNGLKVIENQKTCFLVFFKVSINKIVDI